MDTKTNERVLKAILDIRDQTGNPDCFAEIIQEFYTEDLSIDEIEASLWDLKDNGFINLVPEKHISNTFVITPKAYGYFREKRERQKEEIIKFLQQTVMKVLDWSVPLAIGYFMGKS